MWAAYTAETGPTRLVELLIEAGADPSIQNRKGDTALSWAKWHGATPSAALLEELGAMD
jgi:ankyrin repeat protein